MEIDSHSWQRDPRAEAFRFLSAAANLSRWHKMAVVFGISDHDRGDAVHASIAKVAAECASLAEASDPPTEIGPKLSRAVINALRNWGRNSKRERGTRIPYDDDDPPPPSLGSQRALRRKVLQLHVVGAASRLPEATVGTLLVDIGRIKLSLARQRANMHRGAKQARYLAAEAMMEFDAARVCTAFGRELDHLTEQGRAEFELFPRRADDDERATARGLLGEPSYRPYIEWRMTGTFTRHSDARLRPGGDLHSLRGDLSSWLRQQKQAADRLVLLLEERLRTLGRLHPDNPNVLVVMPRALPPGALGQGTR